ncbi:MAG: hypothetical protein Q8P67_04155, partial [archaeon]|nr:hypothetical protein [archaeon]
PIYLFFFLFEDDDELSSQFHQWQISAEWSDSFSPCLHSLTNRRRKNGDAPLFVEEKLVATIIHFKSGREVWRRREKGGTTAVPLLAA